MRTKRALPWLALLLVAVVGLGGMAAGCGKSSSTTSPVSTGGNGGGGGGGGGGPGPGDTPFDSGTLTAPTGFSRAFPSAGTVGYHCNFHRALGMVGTINIVAGAADSVVTVTASGTTFIPGTVTIRPGGVVNWNVTQGTHTVTSD